MSRRPVGDRLVKSPMEALVAGGAAEAFERQLQQLFRGGYRYLIVDLSGVSAMDSAGIRALVRGNTTAQRVGGTMRLAAAPSAVGRTFPTAHVEVFARNQIVFEPREISKSDDVTVTYFTWLDPRTSLEDLSGQLMAGGAGVKSVAWEHPKRERP